MLALPLSVTELTPLLVTILPFTFTVALDEMFNVATGVLVPTLRVIVRSLFTVRIAEPATLTTPVALKPAEAVAEGNGWKPTDKLSVVIEPWSNVRLPCVTPLLLVWL